MSYQPAAPGDWGEMEEAPGITVAREELLTADNSPHFLRSWETGSANALLIMHGLGGHSGWYIDMGNALAAQGLSVYAMDHRGFGRSGGFPGHIDDYQTFLQDIQFVLAAIRKRHPAGKIYLLGHSMGGLFAAHFAATHANMLDGLILLNVWIQDTSKLRLLDSIAILLGGFFKSKHYWTTGNTATMTTNPQALQMLHADIYWRKQVTSSLLFQTLRMRLAMTSIAQTITLPTLMLQAEADKAIIIKANQKFYEALASQDKTWKSYPNYGHDSEFEPDHSRLDADILAWIRQHASNKSSASGASETTPRETSGA
ncbi:MAG TPA: alpha/beta fold hydrolase [Ktedonobacteraceae bacterium]|nr:alpha/beta fold hydrolase [Ktedonobacteraceae bacterium]